ncbi:MAG: hypothetical protein FH748_16110 [Balneolaceae bacterium]|nr:hypothetical protein [Balneolaceae bacterium]
MKKFILCILLVSCLHISAIAQTVTALSGNIIKLEKKPEQSNQLSDPISIADFRYQRTDISQSSFIDAPRNKPGVAFLASALVPGSGQAANGKWVRAGVFLATEVVGIIYHLDQQHKAERRERAYEAYTHKNWSVMAYAQWLVKYSQVHQLNNNWQQLESAINGKNPDFSNTTNDWAKVNLSLLHETERKTPFILNDPDGCSTNESVSCNRKSNFSHNLPDYGSQQYYELISKYYQFQPGWRDFYNEAVNTSSANYDPTHIFAYMWNGQDQPFDMFYNGRDQAQLFNDNYRTAGNILKLLLVNHVVSAFDAYFTVKLKNSRIEAETNLMSREQLSLTWHF